MRNFKVTGIVIRRNNFGEADRIISVLTKEQGKIKLIGKGIRKINSRRASHLEIFSLVNISLYQSSKNAYITEAQVINNYSSIRSNLRKVAIAYHLCDIVNQLIPEKEENPGLFSNLVNVFAILDQEDSFDTIRKEVRLFAQKLLFDLGYLKDNSNYKYSQIIDSIEAVIEKPLNSVKMMTRLGQTK